VAFDRPTLPELIKRVEGDIKGPLGIVTVLRRSFIGVISRALAGLAHLLFGFLKFIEKNAFPDTAETEFLDRWAGIWGVSRLIATFAQFQLTVTGTDGTTIPAGTVYQRDDGAEYTVDTEVTLASGGVLDLTAVTAGAAGNLELADNLSIQSPIAGLDSEGTVTSITTDAEDAEGDESLRSRLIDRIQNPPSGGAANDYLQWALSVPGVTRAWVLPQNLGPGTVGVSFVEDDENPITPSPAKIQEVVDFIEPLRPVTANVNVFAPNLLAIDMTIQLKPNTAEVQTNVQTELEDMILREAALNGAFGGPGVTLDGKILLSKMNEAISIALGEEDHLITVINGGAPADVAPATGELAVLGTITWQPLP